ncbi:hypothetical protein QO239_03725 [Cupriavidus taiwanensis]|uniref:hypothetical protein n=1 Tax=Cupriavidus taiwanensis TaxID=164546 RepID=UPI002540DA13|nr:hypothetical protein [Cupriavidus taiwanensis]MDK3021715.1 hypothetical protein [Cupriavidus taiwanensis]
MLKMILKLFRARQSSQAAAPVAAPAPKPAAEKPRKDRRKLRRAQRRASHGVVRIDSDGPLIEQVRQVVQKGKPWTSQ